MLKINEEEEALAEIRRRNPIILDSYAEMRRADQKAGIFNSCEQSTFFNLDPEAAACNYVINNPNS